MNTIRTGVAALAVAALAAPAAHANDALKAEAAGVVQAFGDELKAALGAGMQEGGPVNALGVCNEKAPRIAAAVTAAKGWTVGRTSLKLRNPNNKPDAWELAVLNGFEERLAKGEPAGELAFAEVVDIGGKKQFRFMKAIPTGGVCLNCHGGADVKPDVEAKVNALYPHDLARGYAVGDLRGAFSISKDM
ncbi:MAG: DUF3365 domain-containing protein [Alphaproteobacteria bacterium]|nr:DUF3365 domain-containing protein [Alphaproteobacteria bacterium]MBF0251749.1 DUF3365 domain-containing protein [Alphaproteobacteria bacterium]